MYITHYTIITKRDKTELIDGVNNLIQDGWQPFGGPLFDGGFYFQAMVKYQPKGKR
jgi:hypothetical protein